MNYSIADKPPTNAGKYSPVPPNDIEAKYVESLVALLEQQAFDIVAKGVPLGWIVEADKKWPITGYRIVMERIPVNDGTQLSTAFGNFYFERLPGK